LLNKAVQPALSLIEGLKRWDEISDWLREPPRKREYQRKKWGA
jgi:hypothetical protein